MERVAEVKHCNGPGTAAWEEILFLGKHKVSSFLCRIRINLSLHARISQAMEIAAPSQDVVSVNDSLESDVAGDNSGKLDNAPALSH